MTAVESTGPTLMDLLPHHNLEWGTRRFVRLARFHGSQKLNLMRATRLPANSRKYNHGDPVNLIDWRVFARTEQLTVKEQQDEASSAVTIVVQSSSSMLWPSDSILEEINQPSCSKQELACRIACHLAYQAMKAGDRVRLLWVLGEKVFPIHIRTQIELGMFFQTLASNRFSYVPNSIERDIGWVEKEKADFFYWISDGLDGIPEWLNPNFFKYACWIHTLSSLELSDAWMDGDYCYFDNESETKEYLGNQLKSSRSYETAVVKWQEVMKNKWLMQFRNYFLVTEAMPMKSYLKSIQRLWEFPEGPQLGGR